MSVAGCQVSAGGRWGRISQPALQNLELIFASGCDNDGCIDASFIDSIRPLSIEAVGWMDVLFFYISVRFAGNADPHKRLANC